jgi:hypothetical protein
MRVPKSLSKISDFIFLRIIGLLTWDLVRSILTGKTFNITFWEYTKFQSLCDKSPYILVTRKKSHLTTYLISLGNFILVGKLGYWSHAALVNKEEVYEALGSGVQKNSLMYALQSDSAALLLPKGISVEDWSKVLLEAKENIGRKYDAGFDLSSDDKLSCIEYVWDALREVPNHMERWPNFMGMVLLKGNVTPQMLYDSGDFDVVLEIRK